VTGFKSKRGLGTLATVFVVMGAVVAAAPTLAWAQAPGRGNPDGMTSEIFLTATDSCPRDTVPVSGQLVRVPGYAAMYSLLGVRYGGDPGHTFGLPKLAPLKNGKNKKGSLRWCTNLRAVYPTKGGAGEPTALAEVMPLAASYCPDGWRKNVGKSLPHAGKIMWCSDTTPRVNGLGHIGRVHLYSGGKCPASTFPADGTILSISLYGTLYAVLGSAYGGDGRRDFALPDLTSPAPGLKWCVVAFGKYPLW
jgi:microcystin-dependent protein